MRRTLWGSLLLLGCASRPASPAALVDATRFECSLVLGLAVTGEWFNAGFEDVVQD